MVLEEEKWVSGVPPEALLGASGSTFWVSGVNFLCFWCGILEFGGPIAIIFNKNISSIFMNLHQALPLSISLYQLSISFYIRLDPFCISLYQLLPISIDL